MGGRVHKFNAKPNIYNGIRYASRMEADYARDLDLFVQAGKVLYWNRPGPRILVPGKLRSERVTYQPDFEVAWNNPCGVEFIDIKGFMTQIFRIKALMWRQAFPNDPLRIIMKDGSTHRLSWLPNMIYA